jgi:hypothetical protein
MRARTSNVNEEKAKVKTFQSSVTVCSFCQLVKMSQTKIVEFVSKRGKRSLVWEHFGFPVKEDGSTDGTKTICKLCQTVLPYSGGSTTGMNSHLSRRHWNIVNGEGNIFLFIDN